MREPQTHRRSRPGKPGSSLRPKVIPRTEKGRMGRERSTRVLVADDDDMVRKVLVRGLTRLGFDVVAVADGENALREARQGSFDVVMLDWIMPGLQGPDVCEALRAFELTAEIPIVMITARGDQTEVEAAYARGADEYLTKPFVMSEVKAVLALVLERPRTLRHGGPGRPVGGYDAVSARLDGMEQALEKARAELAALRASDEEPRA